MSRESENYLSLPAKNGPIICINKIGITGSFIPKGITGSSTPKGITGSSTPKQQETWITIDLQGFYTDVPETNPKYGIKYCDAN